MINGKKIICTVGPSISSKQKLLQLKDRGVDGFRINLSHTNIEDLESKIILLKEIDVPIILDTEGYQVRTGNISNIEFNTGDTIKIYNYEVDCNSREIFLNPKDIIYKFQMGDLLYLDFNGVLLKITNISPRGDNGFVEAAVLLGGKVSGKKGVHLELRSKIYSFSDKDLFAFGIAKRYGIKNFSLSFVDSVDDIYRFKQICPDSKFIVKIETKGAVKNLNSILDNCDSILIDRGDLSRDVPLDKIPNVQKHIIKMARERNVEVFIASNTLEDMAFNLKPNRAEVNDIHSALNMGVSGFALTKETAVGNYPIETVNMLISLIKSFEEVDENFFSSNLLVKPHGNKLVNRFFPYERNLTFSNRLDLSLEYLMDIEQMAFGAFSPLEGFMSKADFISVLENYRLTDGNVWSLPILLQIKDILNIKLGDRVGLYYNDKLYAFIDVDDIFEIEEEHIRKWFGTLDESHPGVKTTKENGRFALGGKVSLICRIDFEDKGHCLTPFQTRDIFSAKGWSKVVGFHTRNVIHRSHEFIQLQGLNNFFCDGLFVHPVVGKKKKGDFNKKYIIKSYDMMINNFYPKDKVLFSIFNTYSRYAGPREALFTALVRKNYGCSHFIVGRDHTGVKDFYHPEASHKIFDMFPSDDIGIVPIKFQKVFYSKIKGSYVHDLDDTEHLPEDKLHISGTRAREMIENNECPPAWFMREEISDMLLKALNNKEEVFV